LCLRSACPGVDADDGIAPIFRISQFLMKLQRLNPFFKLVQSLFKLLFGFLVRFVFEEFDKGF